MTTCSFFDEIYNQQRVKPDLKKVEATKKMEVPLTKQELHSISGHDKLLKPIHSFHV